LEELITALIHSSNVLCSERGMYCTTVERSHVLCVLRSTACLVSLLGLVRFGCAVALRLVARSSRLTGPLLRLQTVLRSEIWDLLIFSQLISWSTEVITDQAEELHRKWGECQVTTATILTKILVEDEGIGVKK